MTADAANLLAEIRRSGGDVRAVGCDRLKLVVPAALLPELAQRVRAAKPMLLAVLADTGRIASAAQEGGGGVLNPWCNGATAQHSTAAYSSNRAIATPAADWRPRYREARAYWSAFHPADEAAQLAWGELQIRWHRLHGERVPHWECAGCHGPIGGLAAMTLADSNRVHIDTLDCLLHFGERWRNEATDALRALGLDPPAGSFHERRRAKNRLLQHTGRLRGSEAIAQLSSYAHSASPKSATRGAPAVKIRCLAADGDGGDDALQDRA